MPSVNQHLLEKLRVQGVGLVDDAGRVRVEAACRGCGYNLRGVSAEGECPECGHAVADALRDDRPEHSDPQWLSRVVLGGNLFGVALVVPITLLFVLMLLGLALEAIGSRGHGRALTLYGVVPVIGNAYLLVVVATWLITSGDPDRHDAAAERLYRYIARAGITAGPPIMVLLVSLVDSMFYLSASPVAWSLVTALAIVIPVLILLAGVIALLFCLRGLALRMCEWRLVRSLGTASTGLGAGVIVILVAYVGLPNLGFSPATLGLGILLGGVANLVTLCCGIWAILLGDQTRRALNAARRRMKWAQEDAEAPSPGSNVGQAV